MAIGDSPGDIADEYDFIVVGSGAGGGPLAANLARAGHSVLVIEAGGDDQPTVYDVPAFHAFSTESDLLRWSYYVKHYADEAQGKRDPKYVDRIEDRIERDGILYPRAGTLGGCTAHHALILVYPHNSDWDRIADAVNDESWRPDRMRALFERMEACSYKNKALDVITRGRHGFDGWLPTTVSDARLLLHDTVLKEVVLSAIANSGGEKDTLLDSVERIWTNLESAFDPNDWLRVQHSLEGLTFTPITTRRGARYGARERLLETQASFPGKLTIKLHSLVSKILLDDDKRAVGVEFLDGAHLYRADPNSFGAANPFKRQVKARQEVIIAAGAFNSPQILMLSGIGPADQLARHGIPLVHALPGVGRNLQDRYEIGVVYEVDEDLEILADATFAMPGPEMKPDLPFAQWKRDGRGLYSTNGTVIAKIERSFPTQPEPDLYLFGLAGRFEGYEPGYSTAVLQDKKHFTWVALKAHTRNNAGTVELASEDPRDMPSINFNYFDRKADAEGRDLKSVVEAIGRIRKLAGGQAHLKEVVPGPDVATPDALASFVKDRAWGHHACGTCKMGPESDPMAVVDGDFRVHGIQGLRVVDASIFPHIPGFFIVCAVYMISEKASAAILGN